MKNLSLLFFCLICTLPGLTQGSRQADSLALVALYDATDGKNWHHRYKWTWKTVNEIETWEGVTTRGGRIVELALNHVGLKGCLPEAIGDMTRLVKLNLSGNELIGNIPPTIKHLTQLTLLKLNGNRLNGNIPPEIGSLTRLTHLHLHQNQLSGPFPKEIGTLRNLVILDLYENNISGSFPPEIRTLSALKELHFEKNNLSGSLDALEDLKNLIVLHLPNNRFDTLPNLNALPNLGVGYSYDAVTVKDNYLDFGDILPYVRKIDVYAPQAKLNNVRIRKPSLGKNVTWHVRTYTHRDNTYQWYQDGNPIPGATNAEYTFTYNSRGQHGAYHATVKNPGAPDLTLVRNTIYLHVDAPSDISLSKDEIAEAQPKGTQIGELSATGGAAPYTYEVVKGPFAISGIRDRRLSSSFPFDYKTTKEEKVTIRVTDASGYYYEEELTIRVKEACPKSLAMTLSPNTPKINTERSRSFPTLKVKADVTPREEIRLTGSEKKGTLQSIGATFPTVQGLGSVTSYFDLDLSCSNTGLIRDDYTFRFTAQRVGCSLCPEIKEVLEVNVKLTPNPSQPPTFKRIKPKQTLTLHEPFSLGVSATDADPHDELTLRILQKTLPRSNKPTFMSATAPKNVSSTLKWTPECSLLGNDGSAKTYPITFVATDNSCTTKSTSMTIDFEILPPKISALQLSVKDPDGQPIPQKNSTYLLTTNQTSHFHLTARTTSSPHHQITLRALPKSLPPSETFSFPHAAGKGSASSTLTWTPECSLLEDKSISKTYPITFSMAHANCPNVQSDSTLTLNFEIQDSKVDYDSFLPPNVFTPNGDGINDTYQLKGALKKSYSLPPDNCASQFQSIVIHDRSGRVYLRSKDRWFEWKGEKAPTGVYYYKIDYSHTYYKGIIQLLR